MTQLLKRPLLFTLALICILLGTCSSISCRREYDSRNRTQSVGQHEAEAQEQSGQTLDPELIAFLNNQTNPVKPFAWGLGINKDIILSGIDQQQKLKILVLKKADNSYVIDSITPRSSRVSHNQVITTSGRLNLSDFLPDDELAFKSDIISTGNCQTHFVLVWQALSRTLRDTPRSPLPEVGVRVIVMKGMTLVANKSLGLRFPDVRRTIAGDINADGKKEYVLLDADNYSHIFIWAVQPDCRLKEIEFKDENDEPDDPAVRQLWIKREPRTSRYEVHAIGYEPITKREKVYWEKTISIYRWDRKEAVYRKVKSITKLEKN